MKTRILFVCLGNICRSPAAEGTLKYLIQEAGMGEAFEVASCGTAAYHLGSLPHETTRKVATRRGIILKSRARKWRSQDIFDFDIIFAMDHQNYKDVLQFAHTPEERSKIKLFRMYDPLHELRHGDIDKIPEVPDPYYGTLQDFENVQDILLRTSKNFLKIFLDKTLT